MLCCSKQQFSKTEHMAKALALMMPEDASSEVEAISWLIYMYIGYSLFLICESFSLNYNINNHLVLEMLTRKSC